MCEGMWMYAVRVCVCEGMWMYGCEGVCVRYGST